MKPMRQIESAQLMTAMNEYSITYARSLVAATPESMLVRPKKPIRGLSGDQIALMENEATSLDREFKTIEHDYGADHLDLVLTTGYLTRLLSNARILRYLAQKFPDILAEFQKITELRKAT
ncbi:plasmid partitioning protein RepB C-terminal domain-containing protein [Sinorhizobium sp. A49]|uniref:plasmid partitioning protein RepB C-terminal domain-containing protein n=1 Tax=Sinorhizobium sp. A49 TaxID=1945861 RepID=UPI0009841092